MLARFIDILWGPWLLGLFLFTGLYFSVRTGFFQLFRVRLWLGEVLGGLRRGTKTQGGGVSQVGALCTALASTIGTGSIAGVATAIWFGGPGAVFWMWVSAFLGMMTGCAEKMLTAAYRERAPDGHWRGGPMYYLRDGLHRPLLAGLFALTVLGATIIGGNLVQSASIAASLHSIAGIPRLLTGAVTAGLCAAVILGGIGRIARLSSVLVPVMALLYIGSGVLVLCVHAQRLPGVLWEIVTCALSPRAAAAGGGGYALSAALRYGVARGVFTNEAGLGTSAIAHASAQGTTPVRQGMWGIFEVFVSTLLVCTVTALVILCSGVYVPAQALSYIAAGNTPPHLLGAPLTAAAFAGALGEGGRWVVTVSLILFAFSSILGWSHYGAQVLEYLTGGTAHVALYRAAFLACVVAGSVMETEGVWLLVDLSNALLAIPNLGALLALSPWVVAQLRALERGGRPAP